MANTEDIRLYSCTATASVLLVVYTLTLIRVMRGSKFKLVVKLIVLLMLYNVGVIAHQWLLKVILDMIKTKSYLHHHSIFMEVLTFEALSIILEIVCFNVSHWMYAFQYHKIVRQAPFTLEMDYVP